VTALSDDPYVGDGKRLATYPANLCRLLLGAEYAKLGVDFCEAVEQAIDCG
jgi:hypothetical protein